VSPDQVLIIIAIVTAAWTGSRILRGPLGDALARRIGGAGHGGVQDADITDLRARVAELEERVDFTERVLLRDRTAGELEQGGRT
jgi:hypothetical protein